MKKFLSLVLALVMTMSLVTISAGATEYKDLTDKDEIQYEEAVAVLNRIGVITGYDDGSFRPTTELTRGAAAKIIVSLLIGPEAASNLPNTNAPYPDVPAGHTFAGVISFCKTKGIISGYGDGTFKPANTLTGYAFAKMLLGAVGYDATLEKFVDTGWTMNVAAVGQSAGLFDRLQFDGSAAVTREQACQLALNALKATVVQYSQGINVNVTGDNTNVVVSGGQTRSYKTSNQEFAKNIRVRYGSNVSSGNLINNIATDYYTVEFAEEHFVDLRLENDKYNPTNDEFGRPSSEWSYKKVTIGTYPLEPDFEFTTQVAHLEATDAAKERALGLKKYDLSGEGYPEGEDNTVLWVNGQKIEAGRSFAFNNKTVSGLSKLADIADLTDNGTLVQVYVSNTDADYITDVVVVQTQLMEVDQVKSDYVSLKRVEPDTKDAKYGYNLAAIHEEVENVREDDEPFAVLKDLKSGDKVAIVPVASSTSSRNGFKVAKAYVPETVSGKLTQVETYGNAGKGPNAVTITVGGTTYKIADWNDEMIGVDANQVKITRKDVTLTLDEYGNALLAKDVGDTSDYMIVGSFGAAVENGKIVNVVNGWTVGGEAISLNTGNRDYSSGTSSIGGSVGVVAPGDLVKYSSNTSGTADWKLVPDKIYDVYVTDPGTEEISARNVSLGLDVDGDATADEYRYANDVKFIYASFDEDGEVESVEIFKGVQNVEHKELLEKNDNWAGGIYSNTAQAYLKDDYVKAVVIKTESNNAKVNNSGYIINYYGNGGIDSDGNKYQSYTVAYTDPDGKWVEDGVITTNKTDLPIGSFFSYTKKEAPNGDEIYTKYDGFFDVRAYDRTTKNTSTALVNGMDVYYNEVSGENKWSKDLFNIGPVHNPAYSMTNVEKNKTLVWNGGDPDTIALNEQFCNVIGGEHGYGTTDADRQGSMRLASNVKWIDLRDSVRNNTGEERIDELADLTAEKVVPSSVKLAILFNDNPNSDDFRTVYIIVVLDAYKAADVADIDVVLESETVQNGDTYGRKLTAKTTSNGQSVTASSYKWEVSSDGTTWTTVSGSNYVVSEGGKVLTIADISSEGGKQFRCSVTYRDRDHTVAGSDNASVTIPAASAAPVVTVETDVEDLTTVRAEDEVTLTASHAAEAGVSYSYQWYKWNARTQKWVAVAGETSQDMTLTGAELAGNTYTCQVTVDDGVSAPAESDLPTPEDMADPDPDKVVEIPDTAGASENDVIITLEYNDTYFQVLQGDTLVKGTTVTVPAGNVSLTFQKKASAPAYITFDENSFTIDPAGELSAAVSGEAVVVSGTITEAATITLEETDLKAGVVAALAETSDLKANPSDTAAVENESQERFNGWTAINPVYTSYEVTAAAGTGDVDVELTIAMEGLKLHLSGVNGLKYPAYWTGFAVPKTLTVEGTNWTVCKADGTEYDSGIFYNSKLPTYILAAEGPFEADDPSGPRQIVDFTRYYKATVGGDTVIIPIAIHATKEITTVAVADHDAAHKTILESAIEAGWPEEVTP